MSKFVIRAVIKDISNTFLMLIDIMHIVGCFDHEFLIEKHDANYSLFETI